jgi:ATP-dependent Clp protease ATP-binding subunit ClpC
VESHFSKEFLGRVDEVLVFNELGFVDLCQIARFELHSLVERAKTLGLSLSVEEGVVEHIASLAHKRRQGARAIKRLVATMIETPLSEQLLFGPLSLQECRVVVEDGEVVVADRVVRSVA